MTRAFSGAPSLCVDLEIDVYLGPVVELTDRLGVALAVIMLSVNLVIHSGQAREAVGAILADDVGLHRMSARIGEVNDGPHHGIILLVEHFAVEQAALLLIFLVGGSMSHHRQHHKNRTGDQWGLLESTSGNHAGFFLFLTISLLFALSSKMQTNIHTLVILYVDGDLLRQMQLLAIGCLHPLEVGRHYIIGLAGGNPLGEFAGLILSDFPLVPLAKHAADFDVDPKNRPTLLPPPPPEHHC